VNSFDFATIAALATPLGRGGIAVIRISGAKTGAVLHAVLEKCPKLLKPRRVFYSFVKDGDKRIDECLVVFFKGPHSYTGEDVAEISIHSNPFLVEEVLNVILRIAPTEIRLALPGEFTYRAYKNGKMDLVQAEAVKELIDANSRYYAHMSFGSLEGRLSSFMQALKAELVNLGVRIETRIEFEEDQFFDEISIRQEIIAPLKRVETLLANARFNELLNKGLSVVIVGKVNVGKSSLFNTLLMEERSIISDIPGTTRDFIREKLYIDGFPIEIVDVAGINQNSQDSIEKLGMQRSLAQVESGDAVIVMVDGSLPLDAVDVDLYERIQKKRKLIVVNKLDKIAQSVPIEILNTFPGEHVVGISVKEHLHIETITAFLKGLVSEVKDKEAEFTINQRQRGALEELNVVLGRAAQMVGVQGSQPELIAEEIRRALAIIGSLMGEITPDDILQQIFSQFCIGK